jgi:uncharacterized membrane protein HdeD (DUF308 family)
MEISAKQEATAIAKTWWLFLITGIAWLLIAVLVLRFNVTSLATVGVLIGVLFLFAAMNEMLLAAAIGGGWRVLHIILAIIFVMGAFWGFFQPVNTVFALASMLGFLLMFVGAMTIIGAAATREENDLWWLGLVVGIFEVLLALWIARDGSIDQRLALILLWVGFFAIFRGISEIGVAFHLHHVRKELES